MKPQSTLHDRIALTLGWSDRDVTSFSLPTLRELVRPVDPSLAAEITEVIALGSHLTR